MLTVACGMAAALACLTVPTIVPVNGRANVTDGARTSAATATMRVKRMGPPRSDENYTPVRGDRQRQLPHELSFQLCGASEGMVVRVRVMRCARSRLGARQFGNRATKK